MNDSHQVLIEMDPLENAFDGNLDTWFRTVTTDPERKKNWPEATVTGFAGDTAQLALDRLLSKTIKGTEKTVRPAEIL